MGAEVTPRYFTVVPPELKEKFTVNLDVKPGSWPTPVNTGIKGVLSVAISDTEDFDVTTIVPETTKLSLKGVEDGVSPLRWT